MSNVPASVTTPNPPQQYGDQAALARAQQAVPTGPSPGGLGAFLRPTDRPDEPVTAGAPFGAGPGPEALASVGVRPGSTLDLALRVRAIASRFPNENLLALLRDLESGEQPDMPGRF